MKDKNSFLNNNQLFRFEELQLDYGYKISTSNTTFESFNTIII